MKLLIVTQKVDKSDPILGFFHQWLEEFAQQCDEVHVIGQFVGEHSLPSNVQIHSLGKEKGASKLRQICTFWKLLFRLQKRCDAMLVHMTPIWVVLGLWCKLPLYLWYEARGTRWPLRVALWRVKKVFSASLQGMPLSSAKSVVVGHGIDTNVFVPGTEKAEHQLISVGRITRAKNIHVLLEALSLLPASFQLSLCGNTITPDDRQYAKVLALDAQSNVSVQSVSQQELIPLLQKAKVFLHASATPLDKAVLEAMACGCPVVSTSEAIQSLLPEICRASNAQTMAQAVQSVMELSDAEYQQLANEQRALVVEKHNLQKLVARLVNIMLS